jgi:hypothetical protein
VNARAAAATNAVLPAPVGALTIVTGADFASLLSRNDATRVERAIARAGPAGIENFSLRSASIETCVPSSSTATATATSRTPARPTLIAANLT